MKPIKTEIRNEEVFQSLVVLFTLFYFFGKIILKRSLHNADDQSLLWKTVPLHCRSFTDHLATEHALITS